jgi:cation-transporting ATPase 13A3/4/5
LIEVQQSFFDGPLKDVFPATATKSDTQIYSDEPSAGVEVMNERQGLLHENSSTGTTEDNYVVSKLRFVEYRCVKFVFHPIRERFVDIGYEDCVKYKHFVYLVNRKFYESTWEDLEKLGGGLDHHTHQNRMCVFGENVIDIKEQSTMTILVNEVFHPFNIFQVLSILLWCMDDYYYYATCIFIISAFSIITTLMETKKVSHLYELWS